MYILTLGVVCIIREIGHSTDAEITTDWVLFMEADEEITPEMHQEILQTMRTTSLNAFYLCYKVILFGNG